MRSWSLDDAKDRAAMQSVIGANLKKLKDFLKKNPSQKD
jgi:hypothetical protein